MNTSTKQGEPPAGGGVVATYSREAILQWLLPTELRSYRTSGPQEVLEGRAMPDCLRLVCALTDDEAERLARRLSEGGFEGVIACEPIADGPLWILLASARALLRRIDKIDWYRTQSSDYWANA